MKESWQVLVKLVQDAVSFAQVMLQLFSVCFVVLVKLDFTKPSHLSFYQIYILILRWPFQHVMWRHHFLSWHTFDVRSFSLMLEFEILHFLFSTISRQKEPSHWNKLTALRNHLYTAWYIHVWGRIAAVPGRFEAGVADRRVVLRISYRQPAF